MRISLKELKERAEKLYEKLRNCNICPRKCSINRLEGKKGVCGVGGKVKVASYGLHFGEESVLVGLRGSGTVFFSGCPLKCVYCQNYDISQLLLGEEISEEELAYIFLEIQRLGALNLNLVTPTHVIPMILKALCIAIEKGFNLPVVYNTGGYDSVETLKLLEGIVDIYMPDVKYSDNEMSKKYSGCPDYWDVVREAVMEMHRQVGDLVIEDGIAVRGVLVRHLVLPEDISGSLKVMDFLKEISPNTAVNVMDQYYPAYKAHKYPELSRRIHPEEYKRVFEYTQNIGLRIIN